MSKLREQTFVLELTGDAADPMVLDEPVEVDAINPDILRAEQLAPQLGIKVEAAAVSFMTLVAYCACKRLGLYTGPDPRQFLYEDCVELVMAKKARPVDPTAPAAGTGSP